MVDVNTGGGASVGGDVGTGKDFIGRDKVVNESFYYVDENVANQILLRIMFIEQAVADVKVELSEVKRSQRDNPTWLQVFMVVMAVVMLITLLVFIARVNAIDKHQ